MVTRVEAWEDVACRDWGAKIVSRLELNKIYIHQLYREYFVEFESLEKWNEFKAYADENIPLWKYDCPSVVDTSDMEQAANFHQFLEDKDKYKVKKILVPIVG